MVDPRAGESSDSFHSAKIQLDEFTRWIGNYNRKVVFDPDRLEQIRVRLIQLQKLKKKYGSLDAVIAKKTELERMVQQSDDFEFELNQLQKFVETAKAKYSVLADAISKKRRKSGTELEKLAVGMMKQLGMEHAVLQTVIETVPDPDSWFEYHSKKVKATAKGMDAVEFYLSANLGEAPKPLAKIASGGEISRIMLSLKSVLAHSDAIPTLIFDEIDVGISGRIAQAVGKALKDLSGNHQLICITHLPQIAAMSDQHHSVIKIQSNGKTTTAIQLLSHNEKIREVAKLLGGEQITETALKNAEELIGQRN
jgi:DNA repair protein RecN (Recombination protein N)